VNGITSDRQRRGSVSGSYHEEVGRAVAADVESVSFFTSILAGFLLGFGLDAWLGTRPGFIIVGIVLGSSVGFWKLWQVSKGGTPDGG
jgi:F0F1-type ATP synthase assembly protein I